MRDCYPLIRRSGRLQQAFDSISTAAKKDRQARKEQSGELGTGEIAGRT